METKKDTTEEKILEAAKEVFVTKGMEGARMQEIADKAGINKALLHYYFRTKERLFDAILSEIIKFAFPKLTGILMSEKSIVNKIEEVVDAYVDLLIRHPFIPAFILKELNRDPSGLFKMVVKFGFNLQGVFDQIQQAIDRGEIKSIRPQHLVTNIVSLCVFPFAARPIVKYVIFNEDQQALEAFYAERAEVIKKFVIDAIVINK
ncbi:MAG TPA: TetR/AcrR family transcriptional regulator [Prolixibacteraceae bacterium]|nr:TetR/AcrR family transcriptional regulator [Prolixibacteraceae bacterium]